MNKNEQGTPNPEKEINKENRIENPLCAHCQNSLKIPPELKEEFEKGVEIAIYCEGCRWLTVFDGDKEPDAIPPRTATRWTETWY